MPRTVRKSFRERLSSHSRLIGLIFVLAIYSGYWVLTPARVQVVSLSPSSLEVTQMQVTLHNPTFKIVTGSVHRIEAEVDVPTSRGGTTALQSVPGDYPFTLLPQSSLQLTVPMIFRVLPGFDYDVTIHIDGVGDNTTTLMIPKV